METSFWTDGQTQTWPPKRVDEDDFEMQQLYVPVIEDATKQRIVMIQDITFHGSMFLQKYERRQQG